MNKKQLYESIMKIVSHEVKKTLNEDVNESLADFRQKYGKKENTEKIAKTYDEVMEIIKPFIEDKTFSKIRVCTVTSNGNPLQAIIVNDENGNEFCEKYCNDKYQKHLYITVDDRAYIEYVKATSNKDELKSINRFANGRVSYDIDNKWAFFFNPNSNILVINLDYLSKADQNIKDLFYKWLGGNVD
ncbi:MAG: hypothetical protein [Wendovervirus sonii]|uniref:Uncharacterized protein n=1 Tax=phage Lak_Megaphage_Sonny TaxID=3109229 RepID=A0ABZ0Z637_9CAUD|nr:MAG: hypothetical protein [phage Lak_Megaphage_Sonny]